MPHEDEPEIGSGDLYPVQAKQLLGRTALVPQHVEAPFFDELNLDDFQRRLQASPAQSSETADYPQVHRIVF